jgi:EmrB/QacA subfamily drug resistance transporter
MEIVMSNETPPPSAISDALIEAGQEQPAAPAGHIPDPAGDRAEGARPGRGWTLAAVCVATFMLLLDLTAVSIALPDIRRSFDSSFSSLQWVLDAYALALAVFLLTAGSVADRSGRKKVFVVGLVAFSVASLACGLAPGIGFLAGARVAQGIGGAVLFAVGPALIGQEYRAKDRAKAFAVFGGVIGLAIAVGPLLGGVLAAADWRYIFLINAPIGAAALAIVLTRMHESRELSPRPVDWGGLATSCLALTLLVLAFLRGESSGWSSAPIVGMFVASALLFVVFLLVERRLGDRAMLDLPLLRNTTFNGLSITTVLYSASAMSVLFLEVSYLQNVLGFSPWQAGLRFLPLTLTTFVVAAVSSGFVEKLAPGVLMGTAMAAVAAGLGLLALASPNSTWTALLPSMIVTGAGMGLFNPLRASLSVSVVEPAKAGMASGMSETFYQVGTSVGIAAFGAFFQSHVSHAFITSGSGRALGTNAGDAVAAGNGAQIAALDHHPGAAAHILAAADTAFVDGLREVAIATAVVAIVGTIAAFILIRKEHLTPAP